MASILNNERKSLTIKYVGGAGEMTLNPGLNLNVPEVELEFLNKHPIFRKWVQYSRIKVFKSTPRAEGELEGFTVSTHKGTDEPIPHLDAKFGKASVRPTPVKGSTLDLETLVKLPVRKLISQINQITNSEGLKQLKRIDDRKTIKEAVDKRLQEVQLMIAETAI
jgi:hypothetical protein